MNYNLDYINLKYDLLRSFLVPANPTILDISYSVADDQITIQTILLSGNVLSDYIKKVLNNNLPDYNIKIEERYLTKEEFNETKGEWAPKYYNWLDNLLFSKAEVL